MIITVKNIEVEAVYPLRSQVLRPGQPIKSCSYEEDSRVGVFHLGIYQNSKLVGIGSFYPENHEYLCDRTSVATGWRLRGMATVPDVRGQGLGTQLLQQGLKECQSRGASVLWCNARTNAVDFYRKLNFDIKGEEFMIENIGLHYLMYYQY